MSTKDQPFMEELTWQQVRQDVANSSQELSSIIDEISPSKKYTVLKVRYPFGSKVLENVEFYLPNEHGYSVPINDPCISSQVRQQLSYSPVPLCITVKNKIEIFREIDGKIFSLAFYGGDMDTGIWEHFGWTTPYSITAGARSLYMIPKISEVSKHKKLKKTFNVSAHPPQKPYEHWKVFTQIANSKNFTSPWFYEAIVLTDKWVDKIKNDLAWYKLQRYLWQKSWQHSGYARRKSILDIVWDVFSRSISSKNIKVNPYIIDTLKHLIFIGTSTVPGSIPAVNDEAGPIKTLQMIYEDCYGLEKYVPTIMQPAYFDLSQPRPVYYSLQVPSLLEPIPKSKKFSSTMDNIRELEELFNHFKKEVIWPKLNIHENVSLDNIISKLHLDFFHDKMFAYGTNIRPTLEMPKTDPALAYDPNSNKKRFFADTGSFLRGCVRIDIK